MKHPGMINKVYNVADEIFNWSEDSFKKASEIIKNTQTQDNKVR